VIFVTLTPAKIHGIAEECNGSIDPETLFSTKWNHRRISGKPPLCEEHKSLL